MAPKLNNKQKEVLSLSTNLLKKFTYHLIHSSQLILSQVPKMGKKQQQQQKKKTVNTCICAGSYHFPVHSIKYQHQNTVAHAVLDNSLFLV